MFEVREKTMYRGAEARGEGTSARRWGLGRGRGREGQERVAKASQEGPTSCAKDMSCALLC